MLFSQRVSVLNDVREAFDFYIRENSSSTIDMSEVESVLKGMEKDIVRNVHSINNLTDNQSSANADHFQLPTNKFSNNNVKNDCCDYSDLTGHQLMNAFYEDNGDDAFWSTPNTVANQKTMKDPFPDTPIGFNDRSEQVLPGCVESEAVNLFVNHEFDFGGGNFLENKSDQDNKDTEKSDVTPMQQKCDQSEASSNDVTTVTVNDENKNTTGVIITSKQHLEKENDGIEKQQKLNTESAPLQATDSSKEKTTMRSQRTMTEQKAGTRCHLNETQGSAATKKNVLRKLEHPTRQNARMAAKQLFRRTILRIATFLIDCGKPSVMDADKLSHAPS